MAGSVESQVQHRKEQAMAMNAIIEQWEVQYARFIYYPPLSSLSAAAASHHPSITPRSTMNRKCRRGGVWISTSSSNSFPSATTVASSATLKLIADCSAGSADAILNISLRSKVLEEHYISQLQFSWPQVSCVSGFPARGTRSVFLSYKDSLGQVQKFALRFVTVQETEKFIHVLKETLEDTESEGLPSAELFSELSSQSEFVPSNGLSYRAEEGCRNTISADNYGNKMLETQNNDVAQLHTMQEAMPNSQAEEILSDFPPSFASFLMNCCPAAAKEQSKGLEEADLKSLIARYLEDSSFQGVLLILQTKCETGVPLTDALLTDAYRSQFWGKSGFSICSLKWRKS